ncbi:MAG: FkbM family methyltransferase [Deferribacteraceae bacterium]|nr:FkbM family methyltransferase [Deferribacteraceae bacterium]
MTENIQISSKKENSFNSIEGDLQPHTAPRWKCFFYDKIRAFCKLLYSFASRSQLLKALVKRIVVKLIGWYITPIVQKQSVVNTDIVQTFDEIKQSRSSYEAELLDRLSKHEQKLLERLGEYENNQRNANTAILKLESDMDRLRNLGLDIFSNNNDEGVKYFSQNGEDCIVNTLLSSLAIPPEKVRYLDLGANHAKHLSNSYFFYLRGARGVLVEPNPALIQELKFYRYGDIVLNRCVSEHSGELIDFYIFDNGDGLSTDINRAEECLEKNNTLKMSNSIKIETISIMEIFEGYFETAPTILSIDIKGSELTILSSIDFSKYRPMIIIVEMIPYNTTIAMEPRKNLDIVKLLEANNYCEMAFTGINSIFMDKMCWRHG